MEKTNQCKQNLTESEIITEFGKDEIMDKCNGCQNLSYNCGMMSCKLLQESETTRW